MGDSCFSNILRLLIKFRHGGWPGRILERWHACNAQHAIGERTLVEVGKLASARPAEQAARHFEHIVGGAGLLRVDAFVL